MSQALLVGGALANCGSGALQEEFLEFLLQKTPDLTVFRLVPPPGRVMAAALDWQGVLGTGADLIAYASALWAAYDRFVKPLLKKRNRGPQPFLFATVRRPDGTFAQFSLGQEYDDQEVFVEQFTKQISPLRAGDGESDEELISEFSQREEWVRIHVRGRGHS
jgi:hypothetical protein